MLHRQSTPVTWNCPIRIHFANCCLPRETFCTLALSKGGALLNTLRSSQRPPHQTRCYAAIAFPFQCGAGHLCGRALKTAWQFAWKSNAVLESWGQRREQPRTRSNATLIKWTDGPRIQEMQEVNTNSPEGSAVEILHELKWCPLQSV